MIDSEEPRPNDDAVVVTETWEEDADPGAPAVDPAKSVDDSDDLAELEALARVRSEPWRLVHLMVLIAVIAVACALWVALGWLLVVVFIALSLPMVIGLGFILARLRVARQDALLQILVIATERGMPISTAIAAFADQFRGQARLRAMKVIASLNSGSPLPQALEENPRAVSRDAVLMARIGQVTGMMPDALRLAGVFRSAQLSLWMAAASRLAYLLGMIMAVQMIVAFLLFRVLPQMEAIFRDFNFALPGFTILVIEFSRKIADYAPVSITIGIVEVVLFLYVPFSFSGWMNHKLPVFGRLMTRRHTGLIMRALSLVIESNHPISLGLSTLASHYPTRWARRRLARVETNVRQGSDWIDALWRVGLLRRTDVEVLGSAASVGNLPWALRELAETSERRQALRIRTALQTLFPLVVIAIGIGIGFLALGYFLPLVVLIRRLADQ